MYKFLGKRGDFVPGVPARDLTDEEAKRYGVDNHPLWKKQTKRKSSEAQEEAK